jgi:hypothetical protein
VTGSGGFLDRSLGGDEAISDAAEEGLLPFLGADFVLEAPRLPPGERTHNERKWI